MEPSHATCSPSKKSELATEQPLPSSSSNSVPGPSQSSETPSESPIQRDCERERNAMHGSEPSLRTSLSHVEDWSSSSSSSSEEEEVGELYKSYYDSTSTTPQRNPSFLYQSTISTRQYLPPTYNGNLRKTNEDFEKAAKKSPKPSSVYQSDEKWESKIDEALEDLYLGGRKTHESTVPSTKPVHKKRVRVKTEK